KPRSGGEAGRSIGAKAGEIVTTALDGEGGFISGRGTPNPVIGVAPAAHEGPLMPAECGSALSKPLLTVEGSVIGTVSPTALMTLEETIKFKAAAGLQAPEHFEEGLKDTLLETLTSGAEKTTEQAGLTVTAKDASEAAM